MSPIEATEKLASSGDVGLSPSDIRNSTTHEIGSAACYISYVLQCTAASTPILYSIILTLTRLSAQILARMRGHSSCFGSFCHKLCSILVKVLVLIQSISRLSISSESRMCDSMGILSQKGPPHHLRSDTLEPPMLQLPANVERWALDQGGQQNDLRVHIHIIAPSFFRIGKHIDDGAMGQNKVSGPYSIDRCMHLM